MQPYVECADKSMKIELIKAMDESCVLGKTDGAATAQGAALAVMETIAAVIH